MAARRSRKWQIELGGWGLFTASAVFFWIVAEDLVGAVAAVTFLGGCIAFLIAHFKGE